MRLSLWQQFSSNHSADFTVVGEFDTPESAREAYVKIREVIETIKAWYKAPENAAFTDSDEPIEIEVQTFAPYGVTPSRWIDWMKYQATDNIHKNITHFDNLVLVGAGNTSAAESPFDDLLLSFGARVFVDGEVSGEMAVGLVCKAPDEMTAKRVFDALITDYGNCPIPWLPYYGGKLASDADDVHRNEQLYLAQPEFSADSVLSSEDWLRILELRFATTFRYLPNSIQQEGNLVTASKINFVYNSYVEGFPALIAWLRAQSCDVDYSLIQEV